MVFTRKFTEFRVGDPVDGDGEPKVGVEDGQNTIWAAGPSPTPIGPGVSWTFPQQVPPVRWGAWVRVNPGSGIYVEAKADDAQDAEAIGLVTSSTATTFTIQQSGYIASTLLVPTITGLIAGTVYFLDTATTGNMVPTDALMINQVSRPLFVADSANTGWIVPYRGLIVGGTAAGGGSGPDIDNDSSIVTINQIAHGFVPGDVIRVNTGAAGSPIQYTKAQGNTFINSQAVGVVCLTPAPTANQFTLQFSGYNIGSITVDDMGNPVVASTLYYLSPNTAGKVTSTNPTASGQVSRPIYMPEQGTANLSVNAGYILPQRTIDFNSITPTIHTVVASNTFNPGQAVYILADNTYALALATSLAASQVAGLVINATSSQFTVQQDGWSEGIVDGTYVDTGFSSGNVLYLSAINAGNLSIVVPSVAGQITKPVYVQEKASGRIGQILPQRPIVVTSPVDPTTKTVTQTGHGFSVQDILYVSASGIYAKGLATALNTASVVGIVVQVIDANTFIIQQVGYQNGLLTGLVANSAPYWLSDVTPGLMTQTAPVTTGHYLRQVYIAETASTGWIQETQPQLIAASSGGTGTGWTLINTQTVTAAPFVAVTGITGFDRYLIKLENVIPTTNNVTLQAYTSSNNGATYDTGAGFYSYSTLAGSTSVGDTLIVMETTNLGVPNIVSLGGISGFINVLNPGNTTYNKMLIYEVSNCLNTAGGYEPTSIFGSAARLSTAIVNAIKLGFSGGSTVASGTISLYGTNA